MQMRDPPTRAGSNNDASSSARGCSWTIVTGRNCIVTAPQPLHIRSTGTQGSRQGNLTKWLGAHFLPGTAVRIAGAGLGGPLPEASAAMLFLSWRPKGLPFGGLDIRDGRGPGLWP